ncbi:hypothetical protein MNBD_GAMMA26-55 [hydrothermal vent metagenome]|uniref:DUF4156 domain-containing protein n=1 Tax=hydrothermal vent metagenome TaxID=652676 RepID=A0A3B1BZ64_9ZZZZ
MKHLILLILATIMLSTIGCTFVKLTQEGDRVRVATADEVNGCEHLGETRASLIDTVVGFKRNPETVQDELETLARNSAVNLKGDSVVAISRVVDGNQTFAVYRCNGMPR